MTDGGGLTFAVTTSPSTSTRPESAKLVRNEDTNRTTSTSSLLKQCRSFSTPNHRDRPRFALSRLRHRLGRGNGHILELELQSPWVFDLRDDKVQGVGT